MPSFITNEWTEITPGAWYLRDVDTLRVRLEWSVDGDYMDVTSEDVLPGGPWRLKGVHVASDDYMEMHFRLETQDAFNTALLEGVPNKRELLAASLYGAIVPTLGSGDYSYEEVARKVLKAADALIAEAAKP